MAQLRDAVVQVVASVWEFFWEIALGIVVLWAFFLLMGAVSFADPLWLTLVMAALGVAALLHMLHMRRIVDHDRDLSRRAHMLREHRGF